MHKVVLQCAERVRRRNIGGGNGIKLVGSLTRKNSIWFNGILDVILLKRLLLADPRLVRHG